jgi:hypothetical protein
MPNALIDAAEAAVIAHYATQLAGRLDQGAYVEKMKDMCDEARRAVRLLVSATAEKSDSSVDIRARRVEADERAWVTPTVGARKE